jgi:hypothetical protein
MKSKKIKNKKIKKPYKNPFKFFFIFLLIKFLDGGEEPQN